jgi:hypothetical protein
VMGETHAVGDVARLPVRVDLWAGEQRVVVAERSPSDALVGEGGGRQAGEGAEVGARGVRRLVLRGGLLARYGSPPPTSTTRRCAPRPWRTACVVNRCSGRARARRRRRSAAWWSRRGGPSRPAGRRTSPVERSGDGRHDVAAEVRVGEHRLEQPRDLARRHLAALVGGDRLRDGRGLRRQRQADAGRRRVPRPARHWSLGPGRATEASHCHRASGGRGRTRRPRRRSRAGRGRGDGDPPCRPPPPCLGP